MTLVEWTRLEPGQVEAVVAMLVNRERPTSTRITPSRGDGGVDILDRRADSGRDVVYQVKSYTEGLDSRQKAGIEDSLATLGTDERWKGLGVVSWRLVTPWNPSPEAENWLHDLGTTYGVATVWHGLDFVDQLAAKHPDVIDYYLRGGAARVHEAQLEVLALMGLEGLQETVEIDEATARVQRALGVLNHDPHYRFEFRFGEGQPPPPPASGERPGLVLHTSQSAGRSGNWIAIDVIARCAASTDVQPIMITGNLKAQPGTEWHGISKPSTRTALRSRPPTAPSPVNSSHPVSVARSRTPKSRPDR